MVWLTKQLLLNTLLASIAALLLSLESPAANTNSVAVVKVLLSLPENLDRQSRMYLANLFDSQRFKTDVYSLEHFQATEQTSEGDLVLAAGRDSCEYAGSNLQEHSVLCVLVSAAAFTHIRDARQVPGNSNRFDAIVIDQPLKRQAKIASTVFPSLKKFGVLASGQKNDYSASINGSTVTVDKFRQDQAVASQIVNAISGQDALIAIPDRQVYSSDRLRTVLLTAYGYAKPVIGYSRSYVKAGALITTFTTPSQVYRQAVEILQQYVLQPDDSNGAAVGKLYDPRYFSIMDNPSIAKSLGLVQRFQYRKGYDYIDQDFSS